MQNLFGQLKIELPPHYKDIFGKYCQSGKTGARDKPHIYPFPRNVDMWFLALCIAVKLEIPPIFSNKGDDWGAIQGTVFGTDNWRSDSLVLLAIGHSGNVKIIDNPNDMMKIANAYALAGLPILVAKLDEGHGDNILDYISDYLIEELIEEQ